MKRLLTLAACALCLAVAAPVGADAPWPPGISAAPGMYRVTAAWEGGTAMVMDGDWQHGVYRLNLVTPSDDPLVLIDVRYVPGLGYDGRLGG